MAVVAFLGWRLAQDQAEHGQGLRLAARGQFDAAEPLLARSNERNPRDVDVVRALAVGHLSARHATEAEAFLNRWCELRPDDPEPYRRRLELWTKQQKAAQLVADARQVLRFDPNDFRTRVLLAEWLLIDGRFAEAEEEARRCLRDRPKQTQLWYLLARAYHGQKRTAEATEIADRLVREGPKFSAGLRLRAQLYAEAGQYEPAIRLLRQAAELKEPERVTTLYELSQLLARTGREAEGKQVLAEMRLKQAEDLWEGDEHRDTNAALQARVVDAMMAAGQADRAARFLSDILRRNPGATGTRELLDRLKGHDKVTR